MLKGLIVGAGIFLAGLLLGAVLLAKPGAVGSFASPEITEPVTFLDEVTVGLNNCASRSGVVIPAISGINSAVDAQAARVATSVSLSQTAVGDFAFATWQSATGTLQALNLVMAAPEASSSAVTVTFVNPNTTTSSANNIGLLTVCSFGVTTSTVN